MQNTTTQWRRATQSFRKIYTSHFIERVRKGLLKVLLREGVGDWTELQYIDPHSNGHQRCIFLVLQGCSYRILSPTGPQNQSGVSRAPSARWWFSLPHLVSNLSDLQLTVFLFLPSYIIVQSPTQSLEWHVWSSSSGNNCHAVQKSLSSGAPVYACTMGFYLVPYCHQSPPTWFLLITAIGMCHFLPVHHFGIAYLAGSKVNIQQYDLFEWRKFYFLHNS